MQSTPADHLLLHSGAEEAMQKTKQNKTKKGMYLEGSKGHTCHHERITKDVIAPPVRAFERLDELLLLLLVQHLRVLLRLLALPQHLNYNRTIAVCNYNPACTPTMTVYN
eukprot:TRINITY_DN5525_c0_g1_i6.p1 TRINITY_DN5525_c0_g1~~TRINITY_DN5525_c0_g1_i6.p1  ORF type:complete len:110 (-),score=20.91 TRINITY_DN5525_c0_g1_i6:241-570(-)